MKKNRRNGIKHVLAAVLFCIVMSIGTVSFADEQGTVIAKSAVIRASADPSSDKLASVPSGKTIDIISKTSGTDGNDWYQVYVDANTKGYIRSDLIKVSDGANIKTTQSGSASSAQSADTPTTATPVDARKVTVISNRTNIRKGASTSYDAVATANRGMVLTVIGEADGTDGKKWYQVSFTYNNNEVTGFIRSDLVTSDNVPADSVSSEIEGEENPGEEQPPETTPEVEQPPEQPEEESHPDNDSTIVPMNVAEEPPYIMEGFEPFTFKLPSGDEEYNGYVNGNFLICYARKANGEEGWFLIDQEMKVCQRYAYTADGAVVPKGSVGLIPVIILVVIVVILVAVVGLLLLKLKGQSTPYKRYKSYEDDDLKEDDDIEDLEDMEDDDDEPQLVRRVQGPQPVRRPQGTPSNGSAPQGQPPRRPQAGAGQQPPRRPQTGAGQQPPRRPQGSPGNGSAPQSQPPRRPQNNNVSARPQGQQPARRPQGQQPPRRPQPQNERVPNERVQNEKGQPQKGYKAKNLLEDDDMDIMDIE